MLSSSAEADPLATLSRRYCELLLARFGLLETVKYAGNKKNRSLLSGAGTLT